MTAAIEDFRATDKRMPMRDLIAALQETLRRNHQNILKAARTDWQRSYGASDPSDACATIRIESRSATGKGRAPKCKPKMRWGC